MGATASKANKITPLSVLSVSAKQLQQQNAQLQNELESGKQQNAQVHQQLENSRQQIAQLQQQLESVKQQNAQLQQQLECDKRQNAQLQSGAESEAQLLEAAPNVSTSHATFAKCSAGISSGKNHRCEQYLRNVFNRYKDTSGGLSGLSLVQALQEVDAPTIPTSDQDVEGIIKQFDANSNKTLEFGEFQQ